MASQSLNRTETAGLREERVFEPKKHGLTAE